MPKQTLQQWLDERRKGIGGSDAAAVLSEGYGCPRALFLDKTGVEPDYRHTPGELGLFERGHRLEPIIAQMFTEKTGLKVRRMPTRVSKERPWMRVNVDRCIETVDEAEGPGYLECKTANEHVFQNMLEEGMPPHYVLQVQHGLAVTGWKWGYFAVLEPYTFRFLSFRYERDENMIAVLNSAEEWFWRQVQAGQIPAKLADFNDSRCEKCVYRRGCRNAEALPAKPKSKPNYEQDEHPDLVRLVGALKETDALIEELEVSRGDYRAGIKALMGDRTHVAVPSQGVKFNKGTQSGRLTWDGRALDAEHPELAAKFKRRGEPFEALRMYDARESEGKREAMQEVA
jgi:putative phage-type endonuclease